METEVMHMEFGERLKKIRNEKGLSQRELAKLVYLDSTHISRYENSLCVPGIDKVKRISEVLQVSTDYLILNKEGKGDRKQGIKNPILLEKFKILEGMNKEEQKTIIELIDAMIAKHRLKEVLK